MAGKVKPWVWVVVGVVACGILFIIGLAAVGLWLVKSHVEVHSASPAAVTEDFQTVRARFADQKPLIEIRRGDEPVLHRELIPNATAGRPLQTLRVLAYDPDGGKIVRIAIPMWLLRLAPGSRRMSFLSDNGIDFDSDRVHLTLDDLERRGPGLLVDHTDRHGSLVLVWTE